MTNAAFGQRIRDLRKKRYGTQEALARALKVDRTYVARLELGAFSPRLNTMARLAKALGTTTSRLLKE